MSVSLDPRIGSEIAGYRIESVLGRGGMGVVYLAEDVRLKRRVALKLVAPELAADARFRERFLRESELAASLDHSHIVPVHAAGELEGQLWLAMRYVQGTDLKHLLEQEGPLEPPRALGLVAQVGEALDVAHAHGLVHRDVKPANILVTEEGGREHCYLTDFGLARGSDAETGPVEASHLSGTVDYTAPEQIAHEPLDGRADAYSLACVLYECLAGKPPFRRPRLMATLFAHVNEQPPSLQERRHELAEAIDAVLAKALAKSPEERYETCAELCEEARRALGLAEPRFDRRRLVLAGAGGALAIAAAAAVPAILLTRGGTRRQAVTPKPVLPLTGSSLVRIDPSTSEPVAATRVGSDPEVVAVGERTVWVLDRAGRRLFRVDPETNLVTARVRLAGAAPPVSMVAGEGAVWIGFLSVFSSSLRGYDPVTGSFSVVQSDLYAGAGADGFPLALRGGDLWIVGFTSPSYQGEVRRIRPGTGQIIETIPIPFAVFPWDASTNGVAVGAGAVWVGIKDFFRPGVQNFFRPDSRLLRIDPVTRKVVAVLDFDFRFEDVAVGEGAVWVTNADADAVVRVDPDTNKVADVVRVGRDPGGVAVGEGSVWVANTRDQTVTRVDLKTFDVKTIDVGGTPNDIAVGAGAVWVAVSKLRA